MKKILVLLIALVALVAFAACDQSECEHYDTKEQVFAPDCTNEGYTLRTCKRCGYKYKFNFIEPTGHRLSEVTTSPTCTEQGFVTYDCMMCDYEYISDYKEPSGHTYTSSIVESTCTEVGYTVYTCGCGYSYKTKFTVPNGHKLTSSTTKPDCVNEGYTTYSCSCGYSYKGDIVEPTGHSFTKKITRPSIATTGRTTYTCDECDFSYDSDYVWYSEIFSGAKGDGEGILAYGIDISYWNEDVDFKKLKRAGIDFVIIRAGSVRQQPDYEFEAHYKGAKEAGLDVGCYFYSYAETVSEVEEEVEILLDIIEGKKFEYPVYFDMEEKFQESLSTERRMDMCYAFCELMIENGYFPGVYANNRWLNNYFNKEELCTYFDVWFARYPQDSVDGDTAIYLEDWDFELAEASDYGLWQFTESGRVSGVDGNVDLNIAYKDYPTLIKEYGYNGY